MAVRLPASPRFSHIAFHTTRLRPSDFELPLLACISLYHLGNSLRVILLKSGTL